MKTDRELFLYELNGHGYEFKNKTFTDGKFDDDQLNMVWEMWCASASREGYKLVPVEPSAEVVNHGHQVFLGHFNEGGQTGGRSLYFAYKAMIAAIKIIDAEGDLIDVTSATIENSTPGRKTPPDDEQ